MGDVVDALSHATWNDRAAWETWNPWSGPIWNDCGVCNHVRRTQGNAWPYCSLCTGYARTRLSNLASCLAVAAVLCDAWQRGWKAFAHRDCPLTDCPYHWTPNWWGQSHPGFDTKGMKR